MGGVENIRNVSQDRKEAAWEVAVAAQSKTISTARNIWLAGHLRMDAPDGVSRYVSELHRGQRKKPKNPSGNNRN